MSPDTLDLLHTLGGALSSPKGDVENMDNYLDCIEKEKAKYEDINLKENVEQKTGFCADTDSDYTPDSEEICSDLENVPCKL